jgi:hypothetical protein
MVDGKIQPTETTPETSQNVTPTVIPVGHHEQQEVSGVSVGLRIPPIWRDKLRAWFTHFEAIMMSQKKGDQAMYELVLGQLERQDIDEIYDILIRPPTSNKYQVIKQRLLEVYEESEQRNVQRVLAGIELGDLKPSQLLRRMKMLCGEHLSEETLRSKWLMQLPNNVSSVLALSEKASLQEIALMADKMMEQQTRHEVSVIQQHTHTPEVLVPHQEVFSIGQPYSSPSTSSSASKHRILEDKIDKLTEAITQLVAAQAHNQRGRSPQRNWRGRRDPSSGQRFRTRSQSQRRGFRSHRSVTPTNSSLCYFHQKFGQDAYKCTQPCTFMQQPSTSSTGN